MIWKEFKSMGTEAVVCASIDNSESGLLDKAKDIIDDFSVRFSRFNPESELSRLNNVGGKPVEISELMAELLKEAGKFYRETAGIFDPSVIGSLEAIGYDKDFESLSKQDGAGGSKIDIYNIKKAFDNRVKFNEFSLEDKIFKAPPGFRIDLGGIGKGFIADYLSRGILAECKDFLISLGGDLALKGNSDGGQGWKVGIQDPRKPDRDIYSFHTSGRSLGVATSGIIKRKGENNGVSWHHLIDPLSGLPAENDILSVTAAAPSVTEADIYAKTVLILGVEKGMEFIESKRGAAAVIFTENRGAIFSSNAKDYIF